jgi:fused signal recognition particle receptor
MLSFLKGDKADGPKAGGWLARLKAGLSATRSRLGGQLSALLGRHTKINEALYEELETLLLSCDVGVASTEFLLEQARMRAAR